MRKNVHANEEGKHNQLPWGGGGAGGGGGREPAALIFSFNRDNN